MNVFVLCTGRCGSVTFTKACEHITNYTAAHESRTFHVGNSRLSYPQNHIEADNRLSWILGRLDKEYGDNAFYVHLKRDTHATAKSFLKRWDSGIMRAYHTDILMNYNAMNKNDGDKLQACIDYCDTINSNIELFLKNKTKKMDISLENAKVDFIKFWDMINAEGDYQKAVNEWNVSHNASRQVNGESKMEPEEHNDVKTTLSQLSKLVETLSIHQRQLTGKIDELHSHHEQLYMQQDNVYSQVDSLFSIFSLLDIRHPLPTMRGWPVSPDFVKILISIILEKKPDRIVETGSGVSTLISSYCLEKNGKGTLISFDHDEEFAKVSTKNIQLHGLDHIAKVIYAPLTEMEMQGEKRVWYDSDIIKKEDLKIDILVIDGPPASIQNMVRYPALPIFFEYLSDDAVIILDDAAREGEKKVVERWLKEYPYFTHEYLQTEKGAVTLYRKITGND